MFNRLVDRFVAWPRGTKVATGVALAALVVMVSISAGYALAGSDDPAAEDAIPAEEATLVLSSEETPVEEAAPTAPTTVATTTVASTTTAVPTTTLAPTIAAPTPTTVPTATTVPVEVVSTPISDAAAAAAGNVRWAVFKSGKLYLRGSVPSEEIGAAIFGKASLVLGPDNVIDQYVVDAEAPLPDSAPVYVEDLVLYEYNSAVLRPEFVPLLEVGKVLMSLNPQVTITVVGHTDAAGPDDANLRLSHDRVDAVKSYWVDAGVDAERVVGVAKGESEPIAPNDTPEGQALNRRTEFIVNNLLG